MNKLLIRLSKWEMNLRKKLKHGKGERGTWMFTAIALIVVSGAASGVASAQAAKAQQGAANYAADQARTQAMLAERTAQANAKFAQAAGAEESKRHARKVLELQGSQEAAMASLGIGGTTATDIAAETFDKAKTDELAIRYNADVAAWEAINTGKNAAWTLRSEASQYDIASRNIKKASQINTLTTVLNTAASVASVGAMSGALGKGGSKGSPQGGKTTVPTKVTV